MNEVKEYKKTIPILNIRYSIIIYTDPIEFLRKFDNIRFDHDVRDFQGGFFEIEGHLYLAFLNDGKLTNGMIAHECKHCVNGIFRNIGQKLDIDNDEIECYFLTYLVDEVHKALK